MYVCVLGGKMWKGIPSMKESQTQKGQLPTWRHRECSQGGMHRGFKSKGDVGFLIWVADTYMFIVLIFYAFHRK